MFPNTLNIPIENIIYGKRAMNHARSLAPLEQMKLRRDAHRMFHATNTAMKTPTFGILFRVIVSGSEKNDAGSVKLLVCPV